jgi:hypothetical protein
MSSLTKARSMMGIEPLHSYEVFPSTSAPLGSWTTSHGPSSDPTWCGPNMWCSPRER